MPSVVKSSVVEVRPLPPEVTAARSPLTPSKPTWRTLAPTGIGGIGAEGRRRIGDGGAVEEPPAPACCWPRSEGPASNVSMPSRNAAPPAATVMTVVETIGDLGVGGDDRDRRDCSTRCPAAPPRGRHRHRERELAADRPPASSPTRIRSVTWRSLRISLVITVFGLAPGPLEVWRIALKAGLAGVTPKVVSRTFASARGWSIEDQPS
jgi:hypothetical protein